MSSKLVVPAVTSDAPERRDRCFRPDDELIDRTLDRFDHRLDEPRAVAPHEIVATLDDVLGDRGDVDQIDVGGGTVARDLDVAPNGVQLGVPVEETVADADLEQIRREIGATRRVQQSVRVVEALEVERVVVRLDRLGGPGGSGLAPADGGRHGADAEQDECHRDPSCAC